MGEPPNAAPEWQAESLGLRSIKFEVAWPLKELAMRITFREHGRTDCSNRVRHFGRKLNNSPVTLWSSIV